MIPYTLNGTLLQVEDVSLSFGEAKILNPISVQVQDIVRTDRTQGQVVGVLGPSGVGKTIFSRILTGLQKPTTGKVTVDINGQMTAVRPGLIGLVEQAYPLFQHRTILGNLMLALEKSGLDRKARREKAIGMLAEFELEKKVNHYPSQLSGGQRQRVSIIRALLCAEHYLVMDEPFTGLDPIMKDRTCQLIEKVSLMHEKNTILIVAHDIESLVKISDCLWLFGRERNPDGTIIPGAIIKQQYNLIERDLAWHPDIERTRAFTDFCMEVKEQFLHL